MITILLSAVSHGMLYPNDMLSYLGLGQVFSAQVEGVKIELFPLRMHMGGNEDFLPNHLLMCMGLTERGEMEEVHVSCVVKSSSLKTIPEQTRRIQDSGQITAVTHHHSSSGQLRAPRADKRHNRSQPSHLGP